MKGIFVGTVLLIAILTLVISGAFFVVLSSEYINLKISLKASEILKAADIVEAVKRGLDIAYTYSFLQAAYEVGKLGGYSDEKDIKEWRVYEVTHFPASYVESVRIKTENYIEEYLKALEGTREEFKFSKPSVTLLFPASGEIKMIVSFSSPFTYSGYFFRVYDNPNRTVYIPHDFEYFKLYDTAYKLFVERDVIREAIERAAEKMDEKCKRIYLGDVCEQNKKDSETILNENCPEADEKFKEKILREIEILKSNTANINLYVNNIEVTHESNEKYDDVRESEDCENHKKYYKLVYSYSYLAAVKVTVNISTKDEYLVYDPVEGDTRPRNLVLTFNVTTSNDYKWKPL